MFRRNPLSVFISLSLVPFFAASQTTITPVEINNTKHNQISQAIVESLKSRGVNTQQVAFEWRNSDPFPRVVYSPTANRPIIIELVDSSSQRMSSAELTNKSEKFQVTVASRMSQQQIFTSNAKQAKLVSEVTGAFQRTLNAVTANANQVQIEELKKHPMVKRVYEDTLRFRQLNESVDIIGAPTLWQMTDTQGNPLTGVGIEVGIIDTGIDYTHPALGGCIGQDCKVIGGYDFHYDDNDPSDIDGHGTHVAGIVAANSEDLKGVAPDAKLWALKSLGDEGFGFQSNTVRAIEYSMDPDGDPSTDDALDVINMSLGGFGDKDSPDSLAADAAVEAGIVVVVAAGNDGSYGNISSASPASSRRAITVASTTKDDQVSDFSSKGDANNLGRFKPEVSAPGSSIYSLAPNNSFASLSGTSMASPHVAGAAALMLQDEPDLRPDDIAERMMASSALLEDSAFAQGTGRLDLPRTLTVELMTKQGGLNFGTLDRDSESWSSTRTLTFVNDSDSDLVLELSRLGNFPDTIEVSFDNIEGQTLTVPAKGVFDLSVSLLAALPSEVEFPEGRYPAHEDILLAVFGEQTLNIPLNFEQSINFTLINSSDEGVDFNLEATDGSYFFPFGYIEPNSELNFKLAANQYEIGGYQFEVTNNIDGLPDGKDLFKVFYSDLNMSDDTSFTVSFENNNTYYGLSSASANGEVLDDELVVRLGPSFKTKIGDAIYTNQGIGANQQWFLGVDENVSPNKFALSNPVSILSDTEENQDESTLVYLNLIAVNDENHELGLLNLDLDSDTKLPITLLDESLGDGDTSEVAEQSLEISSTFNEFGFADFSVSIPTPHALYIGQVGTTLDAFTHKINITKDIDPETIQKQSVNFFSEDSAWFVRADYNALSLKELDLSTPKYFSAQVYLDKDKQILNFAQQYESNQLFHFTDDLGNAYLSLDGLVAHLYCDDNLVEVISIDLVNATEYDYSLQECSINKAELEYPAGILSSSAKSTLEVYSEDLELGFANGFLLSLKAKETDSLVADSTINRIEHIFVFEQVASTLPLVVKTKLGSNEWQEQNYQAIETSTFDAEAFEFSLPMSEGENLLSLMFEYGDETTGYRYVFNDAFWFGADAGEDKDVDGDGISNDDDTDNDNDGVEDSQDAFKFDPSESVDTDSDGIGNNADSDDDNDGVEDNVDAFPLDATESIDTDSDGIGNNADTDDDNDGVEDSSDAFPLDASESLDTDADGIGNNADSDDDNDGVEDNADAFPLNASESIDTDGDGIGNNADDDDDGDGVPDASDAFPLDSTRQTQPTPTNNDDGGSGGSANLIWLLPLVIIRRLFK